MLVGLVDQVKSWAIGVVESEYLFVGDGHEHIFPHNAAVRLRFTVHLHCHERIAADECVGSASQIHYRDGWRLPP